MNALAGRGRLLLVDDEPFNLEILSEYLVEAGYQTLTAADGEVAWNLVQHDTEGFDAILLDRMMPRMGGMEMLALLKKNPNFQRIPVIMQTAVGAPDAVSEGLSAGAYYYLIKPFQRDVLVAVVNAAVNASREQAQLEQMVSKQLSGASLMLAGDFCFRTLQDARKLTLLLSQACPQPKRVATGLSELLVNAVEHGNLEIGYNEKSRLLKEDRWQEEIGNRLARPDFCKRRVFATFRHVAGFAEIVVRDEGRGFDWKPYMAFSPERAFDSHGRGITMARVLSFDSLEYRGKGNEVVARVKMDNEDANPFP